MMHGISHLKIIVECTRDSLLSRFNTAEAITVCVCVCVFAWGGGRGLHGSPLFRKPRKDCLYFRFCVKRVLYVNSYTVSSGVRAVRAFKSAVWDPEMTLTSPSDLP